MKARLRKLALLAHVASSVGWLGAAAAFLALAAAALGSDDGAAIRAALVAMETVFSDAILPVALATVVIGVGQSLVSPYGLLRHWWVVVKLVLTILAAVIVVMYRDTMAATVALSGDPALPATVLRGLVLSPLVHAAGGLGVLLAALALSIYKPRGLTPLGWQREDALRREQPDRSNAR